MRELFEGIYTKFLADSALTASVTALYNTEAPSNAVFPYIVFQLIDNVPDLDSSQRWENYTIQFNIFDNDPSSGDISDIFALLKGVPANGTGFDYFNLLVDDYNTVVMERTFARLLIVDKIWQYNILYNLMTTFTGSVATEVYSNHMFNLMGL